MPPLLTSSADLIRHPLALRSLLPLLHELAPRSPAANLQFLPTRTIPQVNAVPLSLASLFRRQIVTVTATAPPPSKTTNPLIPTTYSGLNSGPTPGTVVGIVLGSVAGFLLLLWLIYTCFGMGGGVVESSAVVDERRVTEIDERRSRRTSTRRSSPRRAPSSSHSASEVIEVESRRERTPPRREARRDTIIFEETRRRPPEEDTVEVIEEHSPVRRESVKRERRVSGGYRTVDPEAFGGGNRQQRKVRR